MVASMQGLARSHLQAAAELLQDIIAASQVTGSINIPPGSSQIVAEFDPGPAPAFCENEVSYPLAPGYPTLGTLTLPTFATLPQYNPTPVIVDLNLALPDPLDAEAPLAPAVSDVTMPTAPAIEFPAVPDLFGIDLPAPPVIDLPLFEGVDAAAPAAISPTFSYAESAYTSEMLERLRAGFTELLERQATGIIANVEAALWERDRARNDAVGTSLDQGLMASRFPMRPLMERVARAMAGQVRQDWNCSVERDIAIKRAELQQSNRRFAFQITQQFEAMLLDAHDQLQARSYEAARFMQEAAIRIYNSIVRAFSVEVQQFGARAEVFRAELDGELAKIEVYKAELEGQSIVSDINRAQVEVYKAQIAGVLTAVEVYRTQVNAAKAIVDANMTRVSAFGEAIQAFSARVKAKEAEYTGYAAQVEGESSKVDIYKAQSDAFKAETDAYRANVSALVSVKEAEYAVNQEMPIETYIAQAEAYSEIVGAATEQIRGLTAEIEGKTALLATQERADAAAARVQGSGATASAQVVEAGLSLQSSAINTNTTLTDESIAVSAEAARTAGAIASQIGAATYAWAHGSVGISYQDSVRASNSTGRTGAYQSRFGHDERCTTTIYHGS
jgi:hypothetical protein